jgi:hypothetical protein
MAEPDLSATGAALVKALGEHGLSGREIAELLWLATTVHERSTTAPTTSPPRDPSHQPEADPGLEMDPKPSTEPDPPQPPPASGSGSSPPAPATPPAAPVIPRDDRNPSSEGGGLPIELPDPGLIRDPLHLARALRPLNRRIEAGPACVVDEAATVDAIAAATADARASGLQTAVAWRPVLRPRVEPWLDLALVFDRSPSMCFWERFREDLTRLLSRYLRIRDLRLWYLVGDGPGSMLLCTPGGQLHQPRELLRSDGRTLVLIVSDCSDHAWFDGSLPALLATWSAALPTAVLQVLPERLWIRTSLAHHRAVRVKATRPLQPSDHLLQEPLSTWDEDPETPFAQGIGASSTVPILNMEASVLSAWARMLAGDRKGAALAYRFQKDGEHPRRPAAPEEAAERELVPADIEAALESFLFTSTSGARRLASLIAFAPIITLPVVRLIQQQLVWDPPAVQLAEVLLSGLFRTADNRPPTFESIETHRFDFLTADLRQRLRSGVLVGEARQVSEAVTEFVASRLLNRSRSEFEALLLNPGSPGLIQSPSQVPLLGLSAWAGVGGIASSLCSKALLPQPIST